MTAGAWVRKFPSPAAKTAVLLVGCAFYGQSMAANNSLVECDELSQAASQTLDMPTTALTAIMADHYLVPPVDAVVRNADEADADSQALTPLLSLTPRVSSILDQVFAVDSEAADKEAMKEALPKVLVAPVADHKNLSDNEEVDLVIPQNQQQMYRKDI